jgi:hypothetical protein
MPVPRPPALPPPGQNDRVRRSRSFTRHSRYFAGRGTDSEGITYISVPRSPERVRIGEAKVVVGGPPVTTSEGTRRTALAQ